MFKDKLRKWLPKAKPYDDTRPAKNRRHYYHLKLDGHCIVCHMPEGKSKPVILTRQNEDLTALLQWHPMYSLACRLPEGHAVAGELWYPGKSSSDIVTAYKAKDPALQYHVFSVPTMYYAAPLQEVHTQATAWGFSFIAYFTGRQPPYALTALPPDVEGYVLKNGNLTDFVKWKPVKTIDLIVTDVVPGKGKYTGQVGALTCSTTEGDIVANVSGMSDPQRWLFTRNPPIQAVIEVEYQNVGSKGRLRFPRFVQVRTDKAPGECSMCQDPELERYWLCPGT